MFIIPGCGGPTSWFIPSPIIGIITSSSRRLRLSTERLTTLIQIRNIRLTGYEENSGVCKSGTPFIFKAERIVVLKELCHGVFIHFSDLTKLFSH